MKIDGNKFPDLQRGIQYSQKGDSIQEANGTFHSLQKQKQNKWNFPYLVIMKSKDKSCCQNSWNQSTTKEKETQKLMKQIEILWSSYDLNMSP